MKMMTIYDKLSGKLHNYNLLSLFACNPVCGLRIKTESICIIGTNSAWYIMEYFSIKPEGTKIFLRYAQSD